MDETIIQNWNKLVKPYDTVYHLGDFGFGSVNKLTSILIRLNGHKHLCMGSHDIHTNSLLIEPGFVTIKESYLIRYEQTCIFLSHYLHKVWPLSHYNSWHLVGHSHSTMNDYIAKEGKILDVGVDSHNFTPWSLDEVAEVMKTRPNNFNYIKDSNDR